MIQESAPTHKSVRGATTLTGMTRWTQDGWLVQAQLIAVTVLGMVVLIPFAMAAGVAMLVAGAVLLGPIGLLRLVRRR